jgi:succinate-semialdehyde dehydrogenase/glutarate-semialdehyde dehydrogenase
MLTTPRAGYAALLSDPDLLSSEACVAGAWTGADDGRTFAVRNPARGDIICEVPDFGRAETARAIAAAEAAMSSWRRTTAKHRAGILRRWFDLIMAAEADLAAILTAEMGKPLAEAKGEIMPMARASSSGSPRRPSASMARPSPVTSPDKRILVLRQPIGVAASITPWNFPNAMIARKVAPALGRRLRLRRPARRRNAAVGARSGAAGRTGRSAPGPASRSSPPNRVPRSAGVLLQRARSRKLTFTGSTEVGRILLPKRPTR